MFEKVGSPIYIYLQAICCVISPIFTLAWSCQYISLQSLLYKRIWAYCNVASGLGEGKEIYWWHRYGEHEIETCIYKVWKSSWNKRLGFYSTRIQLVGQMYGFLVRMINPNLSHNNFVPTPMQHRSEWLFIQLPSEAVSAQ